MRRTVGLLRRLSPPAGIAVVLMAATALSAQASAAAPLDPITDYATYPAPLPDGCPDGPAALLDVRWTNSRGASSAQLDALAVQPGETITTSWSGFAPGCTAPDGTPLIAVSTAAYDAIAFPFDPTVDQRLLDTWSSCGAGTGPCVAVDGRFSLSLVLPTNDVTCVVQFGTVIGRPLRVVGPNGSFYSAVSRHDQGPNLLIGSQNYGIDRCVVTTTAVVTTIERGTSPETIVATTTDLALDLGKASSSPSGLPFTGSDTRGLLLFAGAITAAGLAVSAFGRRLRRSP